MQTETAKPTLLERIKEKRLAIATVAAPVLLVGSASASVNFTEIINLINAVVTLIPSFMELVIQIAPLIVTIAIVGFVLKFLDRILAWLNF